MIGRFRNALYNAIGGLDESVSSSGFGGGGGGGGGGTAANGAHDGHQPYKGPSAAAAAAAGAPGSAGHGQRVKYPYQRPLFLQLFSDDEIQATADHLVRPIIVPRDVGVLPWCAGYAEAINAGKSLRNEDQASFHRGVLRTCDADLDVGAGDEVEIPYVYFGVFDGHAGSGCAVAAANELHQVRGHVVDLAAVADSVAIMFLSSFKGRPQAPDVGAAPPGV